MKIQFAPVEPSKSKLSSMKGLRLTPTDHLILRRIAEEGFQTYPELRLSALSSYNRTYSWSLLKRLVRFGLLNEVAGDFGRIRGWTISKMGKDLLKSQFDSKCLFDAKAPIYKSAFEHDLFLREIKKILSQSPCISDWVPEHVLKSRVFAQQKLFFVRDQREKLRLIPDAIFKLKNQGRHFNGVLELEMTRKTKQVLYQKLESHLTHESYDFIFFVMKDESLMKYAWDIYQAVLSQSRHLKIKNVRNGIYFALLQNLRSLKLNVPWKGEADTLILRDLFPEVQIVPPDSVG